MLCLSCALLCKRSKLTDDVSKSGVSRAQFGFKKDQTGDEGPALPPKVAISRFWAAVAPTHPVPTGLTSPCTAPGPRRAFNFVSPG